MFWFFAVRLGFMTRFRCVCVSDAFQVHVRFRCVSGACAFPMRFRCVCVFDACAMRVRFLCACVSCARCNTSLRSRSMFWSRRAVRWWPASLPTCVTRTHTSWTWRCWGTWPCCRWTVRWDRWSWAGGVLLSQTSPPPPASSSGVCQVSPLGAHLQLHRLSIRTRFGSDGPFYTRCWAEPIGSISSPWALSSRLLLPPWILSLRPGSTQWVTQERMQDWRTQVSVRSGIGTSLLFFKHHSEAAVVPHMASGKRWIVYM